MSTGTRPFLKKCEFVMSNLCDFGNIAKNVNMNTSRALGGLQYYSVVLAMQEFVHAEYHRI